MSSNLPNGESILQKSADTCQEGVTPVQSFECRAIRVTPEMKLEPRRGRPSEMATDTAEQRNGDIWE